MISSLKRLFLTYCILFLSIAHFAIAQPKDTTKVGVFITSVYDLDYVQSSFSVEYWMWRLNTKRVFKEYNLFDAANAKEYTRLFTSNEWQDQSDNQVIQENGDTLFGNYENFRSVVRHDFDIAKYPFDEEMLTIEFEGSYFQY